MVNDMVLHIANSFYITNTIEKPNIVDLLLV